jgi:flagellin
LEYTTTNGGVGYSVAGALNSLDVSVLTDSPDDIADLEEIIGVVDATLSAMTDAATSLGSVKARISIQQDFVKSLMDAVSRGVGQLVDADMNEESTKLQALQVKQQLGVQALGIANSSSQSIMQLFQ